MKLTLESASQMAGLTIPAPRVGGGGNVDVHKAAAIGKSESYPDGNPKTSHGAKKVPLHLVPPSAAHYLATAFADGARKYGPYNWRESKVSATVYTAALKRHVDAWFDGEEVSADALVHHLAHAMACCAIILDANSVDMLNDDRPAKGAAGRLQAEFAGATAEPSARALQPGMSIIVYGPQGCGKSRHAAKIAAHFGLTQIVDDWDGRSGVPANGALVLTNVNVGAEVTIRRMYSREMAKLRVWDYAAAMAAAGVQA